MPITIQNVKRRIHFARQRAETREQPPPRQASWWKNNNYSQINYENSLDGCSNNDNVENFTCDISTAIDEYHSENGCSINNCKNDANNTMRAC